MQTGGWTLVLVVGEVVGMVSCSSLLNAKLGGCDAIIILLNSSLSGSCSAINTKID